MLSFTGALAGLEVAALAADSELEVGGLALGAEGLFPALAGSEFTPFNSLEAGLERHAADAGTPLSAEVYEHIAKTAASRSLRRASTASFTPTLERRAALRAATAAVTRLRASIAFPAKCSTLALLGGKSEEIILTSY